MKNMINWFEIPVSDFNRAKKFYESALECEVSENHMQGYRMGFLPSFDGKVSGAIVHGDGYKPSTEGAIIYINGNPDLSSVLTRIEKAGGRVIVPKTQISQEIGWFAFFIDSEGNKVGLHSQN